MGCLRITNTKNPDYYPSPSSHSPTTRPDYLLSQQQPPGQLRYKTYSPSNRHAHPDSTHSAPAESPSPNPPSSPHSPCPPRSAYGTGSSGPARTAGRRSRRAGRSRPISWPGRRGSRGCGSGREEVNTMGRVCWACGEGLLTNCSNPSAPSPIHLAKPHNAPA